MVKYKLLNIVVNDDSFIYLTSNNTHQTNLIWLLFVSFIILMLIVFYITYMVWKKKNYVVIPFLVSSYRMLNRFLFDEGLNDVELKELDVKDEK